MLSKLDILEEYKICLFVKHGVLNNDKNVLPLSFKRWVECPPFDIGRGHMATPSYVCGGKCPHIKMLTEGQMSWGRGLFLHSAKDDTIVFSSIN